MREPYELKFDKAAAAASAGGSASGEWIRHDLIGAPGPRVYSSCCASGDFMYLYGGKHESKTLDDL
jgi:hypothetical protein